MRPGDEHPEGGPARRGDSPGRSGGGWLIGAVLALLLAAPAHEALWWRLYRCRDVCAVHAGEGDDRVAERSALAHLSRLVRRCPGASRYSVTFGHSGYSGFPGVITDRIDYAPRTGSLYGKRHPSDPSSRCFPARFSGVTPDDIHRAAALGHGLDGLDHSR